MPPSAASAAGHFEAMTPNAPGRVLVMIPATVSLLKISLSLSLSPGRCLLHQTDRTCWLSNRESRFRDVLLTASTEEVLKFRP